MSVLSASAEEYGILIELVQEFGGPVLETGTGNGDGARTIAGYEDEVFTVDIERYGWDLGPVVAIVYDSLDFVRGWEGDRFGLAFVDCGWWDHRGRVVEALWDKADGILLHDSHRVVPSPTPDRSWDTEHGLVLWDRR